jgi:hypothetical protein
MLVSEKPATKPRAVKCFKNHVHICCFLISFTVKEAKMSNYTVKFQICGKHKKDDNLKLKNESYRKYQ